MTVWKAGMDSDTYIFNRGYGQDVIHDDSENPLYPDVDVVKFGPGIVLADLSFSRNDKNLTISINGTTDTLTIENQFFYNNLGHAYRQIEEFHFEDGSIITPPDIREILLTSTDGDDVLEGFFAQDVLDGGLGNDLLKGADAGDTYIFDRGYGQDTIFDDQNSIFSDSPDIVEFGPGVAPADLALSREGNDLILTISETGDSLRIIGQFFYNNLGTSLNQVEQFKFTDGTIWTEEDVRLDLLTGTDGDDVITGYFTPDVIDGGHGNDILKGEDGGDTYIFGRGYGQDTVHDDLSSIFANQVDKIIFKEGVLPSDLVLSRDGNDLIMTIADTGDSLRIVAQFLYNNLGHAYDQVEEFHFADGTIWSEAEVRVKLLQGTDGDDVITGYFSYDTLNGGKGNDLLKGGDAGDTYVFNLGDGQDTIYDDQNSVFNTDPDKISFGPGIAPEDIKFARVGAFGWDLRVDYGDQGDNITITNYFKGDYHKVEEILFDDGTHWTQEDVFAVMQTGTDRDDSLIGFGGNDTLEGGLGNDVINGFKGDDTLDGGAGDDFLDGGSGNDTYIWGAGWGNDIIDEFGTHSADTVLIKGVLPSEVVFYRNNENTLIIENTTTGETLTVDEHFRSSLYGMESFIFDDGTTWDRDYVMSISTYRGTSADETFTGTSANETFNTGAGNDVIKAAEGDDILDGGAGDDTLYGDKGSDTYLWGAGKGNDSVIESALGSSNDTIKIEGLNLDDVTLTRSVSTLNNLLITIVATGEVLTVVDHFRGTIFGVEALQFADGTSLDRSQIEANTTYLGTDGDETITTTSGVDTLVGGRGNDTLHGGAGADNYIFNTGDGQDIIDDNGDTTNDKLFLKGIAVADVMVAPAEMNSPDLLITFEGSSDQILVKNALNADPADTIEEFVFDDGTVWTIADVITTIQAANQNAGNDHFQGDSGANILAGGRGNDLLNGNDGSDTYVFNRGDDQDTIEDNGYFDVDKVLIHGYAPNEAVLSYSGVDLIINFTGTSDQITIINTLSYSRYDTVEEIVFDDGTVWTMDSVRETLVSQQSTSGDDTIQGFKSGDLIEGGLGNDSLHGNDGADIYVFNKGDGQDTIRDNGFDDIDQLLIHGYTPAETTLSFSGVDLIISFAGSTDKITIINTLSYSRYDTLDRLVFDDGTIWDMDDARAQLVNQQTTTGDDTIQGFKGGDRIEGGLGNDTLHGNDGADTYVFNKGDGQDTIRDNGFDDVDQLIIHGFTPAETTLSYSGVDLIISFAGSTDKITIINTLNYSRYDTIDRLVFDDGTTWDMNDVRALLMSTAGTAGNDTIIGFKGAETLEGKLGDDFLHGADGSDTYVFTKGDGKDTIEDNGYRDTDKVLIHGYAVSEVTAWRSINHSNSLVLTFAGTDDQITIVNTLNGDRYDGIEQIIFDDGTIWTMADVLPGIQVYNLGDDTIIGGSGNDTLDGGAGNDFIDGGNGEDTIIGGSGDDFMNGGFGLDNFDGGEGIDTVDFTYTDAGAVFDIGAGTASFDHGSVETFVNVENINGTTGNNTIISDAQNNILAGAAGDDTFVFKPNLGNDTITDFVAGAATEDSIRIEGLGLSTFDDVMLLAEQVGDDTVINIDSSNSITLKNVEKAALHTDDFQFI